jgi:hypothetical protein
MMISQSEDHTRNQKKRLVMIFPMAAAMMISSQESHISSQRE